MSLKLPYPRYSGGHSKLTQIKFGGYDHTVSCSEGGIYDMGNLTADNYPVLSARKKRLLLSKKGGVSFGHLAYDGIFIEARSEKGISNPILEVTMMNGEVKPNNEEFDFLLFGRGKRYFAFHGDYIIVMPDKRYLSIKELLNENVVQLHNMEKYICVKNITICDGTYGGMPAKANTIILGEKTNDNYGFGVNFGANAKFRVGDAVRISGCETIPGNNKTAIIREIDGKKLIFLENTFTIPEGQTEYTESGIGESRVVTGEMTEAKGPTVVCGVPDMDYICVQDNRLWGCKGDTIYASRLGDPLNFYNYEGTGGAWSLDVMSEGDFTGCTSYLGYVIFFKEDAIHKIYGDRPSNFGLSTSAAIGVKNGSGGSIAQAGQVLFYHSRAGIMAYSGGVPQNISDAFGTQSFKEAVGGSDGVKYYVSMKDVSTDKTSLFVYDTRSNLWTREDGLDAASIVFDNRLYIATKDRALYALSEPLAEESDKYEADFDFFAEFGDFYNSSPNKKAPLRITARIELDEGATVKFLIKYDSEGDYKLLKEINAVGKRSYNIPMRLRRCDHYRLKIEGVGGFKLYSLAREGYTGSEK